MVSILPDCDARFQEYESRLIGEGMLLDERTVVMEYGRVGQSLRHDVIW